MPAVKRDWERRMREIRMSGVTRGSGGLTAPPYSTDYMRAQEMLQGGQG